MAPRRWRNRFRLNVTRFGLACATLADIPSIAPTSAIAYKCTSELAHELRLLARVLQSVGHHPHLSSDNRGQGPELPGRNDTSRPCGRRKRQTLPTAPMVRCPSLTGDPLGGVSTAPQPSRPLRTTQRASFAPVSRRIVHSTGATGAQPAFCLPKADISHSRMCRTRVDRYRGTGAVLRS